MKIRRQAAAATMAAAYAQSAYAQSTTTATQSTSYTTVTYSDCPTGSMESMITVTADVTATYCPQCEMGSTPGHTTVYTTTYLSLCPTGLTPATYTVTESCSEPTPTWTPGPSHIPQGFTVTTQQCDMCETPGPVTFTEPCGCEANEGTPAATPAATTPAGGSTPAQTTPASGSPAPAASGSAPPAASGSAVCEYVDGQPQAGCSAAGTPAPSSGTGSSGGSAKIPSGAAAPPAAGGSAGSAAPYPTAANTPISTTAVCPGPNCRAAANPGNTTGIETSTGAASSVGSFGVLASSFMALVVAVLAFTL